MPNQDSNQTLAALRERRELVEEAILTLEKTAKPKMNIPSWVVEAVPEPEGDLNEEQIISWLTLRREWIEEAILYFERRARDTSPISTTASASRA